MRREADNGANDVASGKYNIVLPDGRQKRKGCSSEQPFSLLKNLSTGYYFLSYL